MFRFVLTLGVLALLAGCKTTGQVAGGGGPCSDPKFAYGLDYAVAAKCIADGTYASGPGDNGWYVIHWAAMSPKGSTLIPELVAAGEDPNRPNPGGLTPLALALISESAIRNMTVLLENGADLHGRLLTGASLLFLAAGLESNPELVNFLIEQGVDIEHRDDDGRTALLYAVTTADSLVVMIEALIDAGANEAARGAANGGTVLHYAAAGQSHPSVTTYFLKRGRDPNARSSIGETPLHLAARHRDSATVVDALIKAGADVNAAKDNGNSPLHDWALESKTERVMLALLQAGADIEARNLSGFTPLHLAVASNPRTEIPEALVRSGANVNARDNTGRTPLVSAAFGTKEPLVVERLLELGADPSLRTNKGFLPLQFAEQNQALAGTQALRRLRAASNKGS